MASTATADSYDVTRSANRLHTAFQQLEAKIARLSEEAINADQLRAMENENARLRGELAPLEEENTALRQMVDELTGQLEEAIARTERMLGMLEAA